jgi:murein L,D-transpeptidase YafK
LTRRNAQSDFFLAVQVSYPEATDIVLARRHGWAPGGSIMVHGLPNSLKYSRDRYLSNDWTDGCIALSNEDMLDFWLLTGLGTPIEIRP